MSDFELSPRDDGTIEVSNNSSGYSYICDTRLLTCSCPDFITRRRAFSPHDIRRLCKHLLHIHDHLERPPVPLSSEQKALFKTAQEKGKGIPLLKDGKPNKIEEFTLAGVGVELWTSAQGEHWVDVIVGSRIYCFNKKSSCWSFGREPGNARELYKKIYSLVDEFPIDAIKTVKRNSSNDPWRRTVIGEIEGVKIELVLRGRMEAQEIYMDKKEFTVRVGCRSKSSIPGCFWHISDALQHWVECEHDILVSENQEE